MIGQGANRRGAIQALKVMRDIYRNGMSDEVFAWTAASNNQAFLAGRLSVALNAISIVRSAEDSGNQALSADDLSVQVDPHETCRLSRRSRCPKAGWPTRGPSSTIRCSRKSWRRPSARP